MRKGLTIGIAVLALVCAVTGVIAGMDDRDFYFTVTGTETQTVSYVLRGHLESVYVDIDGSATNDVTITSTEDTLLDVGAESADAVYYPRTPRMDYLGGTNTDDLVRFPMAGLITTTLIGANPANRVSTNTITIIYSK